MIFKQLQQTGGAAPATLRLPFDDATELLP